MKKYFPFLAVFLFFSITITAQPVKKVLFEQHTGTWCGWCVDGTYKLDQILEANPGVVIPVKLHNGASDKMSLPVQLEIANGLSIPGYPAGCIDRHQFDGNYFPNRIVSADDYSLNAWEPLVAERLTEIPKIDINALYSVDSETDSLKIILTVEMLETVSGNLKFNAYILEDSVTGTGSGWDQANFLKDRAGWEFSPYYNLPNPVTNYYHRNVVRDLLGGAWGVSGEFANPAETGTVYTHEFSAKLNSAWNKEKIQIVAFVTNDDTKECLNVCYGDTKPPTPPVMELTSASPDVGVLNDGDTFVKKFYIKNISEAQHQFKATMNVSANTPENWSAELPKSELTIEPGATDSIIVRLTAGSSIGLGEIKITIESLTDPSAPKTTGTVLGISQNIENFELISKKEEANSVLPFKTDGNFYFNMTSNDFNKLSDKLPTINNVIWNLGNNDAMSAGDISTLSGLIDRGVDVLVLGYKTLSSLNTGNYLDDLGLQYFGYSQEGYAEGYNNFASFMQGVENNPITGTMSDKILYLERNVKEIHVSKIIEPINTSPILTFRNTQTIYVGTNTEDVEGTKAICGFSILKGNAKIVLLGINPIGLMVETYRDNLINKPLDWFAGTIGVDEQSPNTGVISLTVSPNPVGNFVTINYSLQSEAQQHCSITLYNTLGQELATVLNDYVNPGCYTLKHNLSEVPNGTCYMVMKCGDRVASIPVMILK